jgi:hypothetical protein
MFNNVGNKIKTIAIVTFILNIVAFFGIAIWSCSFFDSMYNMNFGILIFLFLLIVALGAVISWIIALFIYGYGILVQISEQQIQIAQYPYSENTESEDYTEYENP